MGTLKKSETKDTTSVKQPRQRRAARTAGDQAIDTSVDESSTTGESSATTSETQEPFDPKYQFYFQYHMHLSEQRYDSQNQLDKAILTLSSASLGASVAFVKTFSDFGFLAGLPLVFFAWLAFTIAIVCTVESFQVSIDDFTNMIANCYKHIYPEGMEDSQSEGSLKQAVPEEQTDNEQRKAGSERKRISVSTASLNKSARYSFYIGLLLFMIFAGINFTKGSVHMTDKKTTVTFDKPSPKTKPNDSPFGKTAAAPPRPPVAPTPKPATTPSTTKTGGKQ